MTDANTSVLLNLALHDGPRVSTDPPFGRLLLASIALHGAFLVLVANLSVPGSVVRPLATHDVLLVALPKESGKTQRISRPKQIRKTKPVVQRQSASEVPSQPVKVSTSTEPKSLPVRPVAVAKPKPMPPPEQPTLLPVPETPSASSEVKARSDTLLQDALAKLDRPPSPPTPSFRKSKTQSDVELEEAMERIALPPQTPKFKEIASVPTVEPTPTLPSPPMPTQPSASSKTQVDEAASQRLKKDVDSTLEKLKVPDVKPTAAPPEPKVDVHMRKRDQSSLTEDVKNKLRSIEQMKQARAAAPVVRDREVKASSQTPSQEKNRVAAVQDPAKSGKRTTVIEAAGAAPGSSEYLGRVKRKIDRFWKAPPVDPSGGTLLVVIKFRLHRTGTISDVVVEQPSGNHYYDLAAERAVRSADPLPSFPNSLHDSYLDTHFTFVVGDHLG